jgi:hypothetical protein
VDTLVVATVIVMLSSVVGSTLAWAFARMLLDALEPARPVEGFATPSLVRVVTPLE